jgi:putative transposase
MIGASRSGGRAASWNSIGPPSTYHYKSRRREQAGLEARIKEICQTRVRYGYRRVHVLLRREGWEINLKKTLRSCGAVGSS